MTAALEASLTGGQKSHGDHAYDEIYEQEGAMETLQGVHNVDSHSSGTPQEIAETQATNTDDNDAIIPESPAQRRSSPAADMEETDWQPT